jgi:hypothetical protein
MYMSSVFLRRSGAAKLHLEGMAKQLPQCGAQPAGQPAPVAALALKRITHLRQAVFKVWRLARLTTRAVQPEVSGRPVIRSEPPWQHCPHPPYPQRPCFVLPQQQQGVDEASEACTYVSQAHYQYLLFLRNTFDRAAASAGTGAAARRLADAMCQESCALRRVLDIEVARTATRRTSSV